MKIISLNVKGIQNTVKRNTMFHWLREQKADLILLQETHCNTLEEKNSWSREWEGKAFWCNGSNVSRGVACLVKPKLDITVKETGNDEHGRFLALNVIVEDKNIDIINIYAPNKGKERANFYRELERKIDNLKSDNSELIVGGDFNCTLNPTLDRRYNSAHENTNVDIGHKQLIDLLESQNLEDVWRRRYPNSRKYTFFRPNSKSASRIDLWLVSKSLDSDVTKCTMKQAIKTDHSAIVLEFKASEMERGPGIWKLNKKILDSEFFINIFMSFWNGWKNEFKKYSSKKKWWELFKIKTKDLCILAAKHIEKNKRKQKLELEKKLENEKNKISPDLELISELEIQQNQYWYEKAEGAKLRSKLKWVEEGEKSSKFFFGLEKTNAKNKLWSQVKTDDGIIKTGIENVLNEQITFYEKLLTSEGWNKDEAESLLEQIDEKLTTEHAELCESEITGAEIDKIIKTLKLNKSPGEDGLTAEFYHKFWPIFREEFIQVVKEIESSGSLCDSQYKGVISLIYKQGDRDLIKNWRPITLLNIDYKIIARIYAERLKTVLPCIISEDQRAFLKGRQISESVRLTQDIINQAEENNSEGAIIFLDQEKAYDRIEWGYLEACLKSFGFGPNFCKAITMLYKKGKSCIITNGFTSRFFSISRSMRQGCPIAAYLYILQSEPMAIAVRKSPNIEGIKLGTKQNAKTVKISMFADDTQYFHRSERSVREGFKISEKYEKASGAKINFTKTKGLYIGSWKEKQPVYTKIKWVNSVKAIGVEFGFNINFEEIWMKKFAKFKEKLSFWKKRDLTLKGKKLLINSFLVPILSHGAEMYTANISDNFLKLTKELICDFLWKGKVWHISKRTMSLRKQHGGIELPDIENIMKSKALQWIIKVNFSETKNWNVIGKEYLEKLDTAFNQPFFLLNCSNLKGTNLQNMPNFYKTCLEVWIQEKRKKKPKHWEEILEENIFGNINFTIGNNTKLERKTERPSLFFSHWAKSGLKKVKDIWDLETNNWVTGPFIFGKLCRKNNWLAEFNIIKRAINPIWFKCLQSKNSTFFRTNDDNIISDETEIVVTSDYIKKGGTPVNLSKLKFKDIYFKCLYPSTKPTSCSTWEQLFLEKIEWEEIFKEIENMLQTSKRLNFHWKTIHRAIYTESRLQKMKQSDGVCKLCNSDTETIIHLIFECKLVNDLWKKVEALVQNIFNLNIKFTEKDVLFGMYFNDATVKSLINFLLLETKWQIWKHRNEIKYGNKEIKKVENLFNYLKRSIKEESSFILNNVRKKQSSKKTIKIINIFEKLQNNIVL